MKAAVIRTGGKQYRVEVGTRLSVEKLPSDEGAKVSFPEVLFFQDGSQVAVGSPLVPRATVEGKILEQKRSKKILVFKKRRRKNYRRRNGHRQPVTVVEITQIKSA
ncbi:MAG: 50S ribosomal protein L21 [Holosporales bacterium]|jgi:large subunit ribosomal protein L21|nr:50S ribosomal protein L21 [Holosporales bacterium]